MHGTNMKIGKR